MDRVYCDSLNSSSTGGFIVGGNNTTLNFASFKNLDGADNYRSFINIMRN